MTQFATWGLGALLSMLCAACSFATLGRVTVNGRDAPGALTQVRVVRDNAEVPTERGMSLKKGDSIETTGDAAVLIEFAAAEAVLFPKSKISLLNPSIFEWFGELWVNGLFTTKTDYGTAAAEGTEYFAQVDPQARTATLTVLEGRVRFDSLPGHWGSFTAQRGERVILRKDPTSAGSVQRSQLSSQEYNALLRRLNTTGLVSAFLVPDVTGISLEHARAELNSQGLASETRSVPADPARLGQVVSQSPSAGQRSLRVRLDVGARAIQVPKLVGLSADEARRLLAPLNLTLGQISQRYTGHHRTGSIIEQSPATGASVVDGASVAITMEAQPVTVPTLLNLSLPEAKSLLAQNGLRLGRVSSRPSEAKADVVLEQHPAPSTSVGPASSVDLVVTRAAPPPTCDVPDVTTLDVPPNEIEKKLESLGWNANVEEQGHGGDFSIQSQSPAKGTRVPCGSLIRVVVKRYNG